MPEGGGYTHHPHQYLEIDMATKNNKEINISNMLTIKPITDNQKVVFNTWKEQGKPL